MITTKEKKNAISIEAARIQRELAIDDASMAVLKSWAECLHFFNGYPDQLKKAQLEIWETAKAYWGPEASVEFYGNGFVVKHPDGKLKKFGDLPGNEIPITKWNFG